MERARAIPEPRGAEVRDRPDGAEGIHQLPGDDGAGVRVRAALFREGGGAGDPVCTKLKVATLGEKLEYEAVSYSVDGQPPSHPIRCNTHTVLITANIYAALQQLRHGDRARHLWIDQISGQNFVNLFCSE